MDENTAQDNTIATQPIASAGSAANPAPVSATTATTPAPQEKKIIDKKTEAMLAMEGEEGRLRREQAEKEQGKNKMIEGFEEEKRKIRERLSELGKSREELESKWIDLSSKKDELQKMLDPILVAETKTEKDVQAKNQEEHATDDPKERQAFEKERQALEAERQKTEKEKWVLEDKMGEINKIINDNKTKYQTILKEEYDLSDKMKEIDEKIKSVRQ